MVAGCCINSDWRRVRLAISTTTQTTLWPPDILLPVRTVEVQDKGVGPLPPVEPPLGDFTIVDIQILAAEVARLQQVEAAAAAQLAIAARDLELQRQLNARLEQQVALLEDQLEILFVHLRILRRSR